MARIMSIMNITSESGESMAAIKIKQISGKEETSKKFTAILENIRTNPMESPCAGL